MVRIISDLRKNAASLGVCPYTTRYAVFEPVHRYVMEKTA